MAVVLDWLGTATFRLTVGDTVVFLDSYIERVPAAAPVGVRLADIERCDYVLVGHSHFDHLWGATEIALQSGATVIGSYETVRMLIDGGVPARQCLAVAGGERVAMGDAASVRVYPSLHTCLWCLPVGGLTDPDVVCTGDLGVDFVARERRTIETVGSWTADDDVLTHLGSGPHSRGDGGALVYMIETADGSVLWQDSAGCWTPLLAGLRPDVVLLAAVGRPNVDGEPYQGSLVQFVGNEVAMLQAPRVALCHHDDWMPPVTGALPTAPFAAELARRELPAELLALDYLEGRRLF